MSKTNNSAVVKKVLDYLMDQNRPFNVNDILSHFQNDCNKTAVSKALDLLISEEKVKEKTYGKQKVFYINQNLFEETKSDDLQAIDSQINELSNTVTTLKVQIKKSQSILEELESSLTTQKAEEELKNVRAEILSLKEKLDKIESKSSMIDPQELDLMNKSKERYLKMYKHRKRVANNALDAIMEGYPKSRKLLIEEIDIQLDTGLIS